MNDADAPLLNRKLAGRYRVDALIARGGMARVYRARDERLDRDVALKVLSTPYADDADFIARFLGEGRAAASITHPSLVHVYDSGSDGAAHFLAMELLDQHRSLRQVLDEGRRIGAAEAIRIGHELLAGLAAVHERGLVHCDVKAGNVMLGPGPAKLIDFGIATEPHDGIQGDTSIGSLPYMSPEQLHGEALTPASDLFSLGVVLYEALTGQLPYAGRTAGEVSDAHVAGSVRPPSELADHVPGRLDAAILQALRRDPEARFRNADAMRRALDAASAELEANRQDETRVVRSPRPTAGYVPPPAIPGPPTQRREPRPPSRAPSRRERPSRQSRRGASLAGWLGTLAILGAAALVTIFIVLPLLDLGSNGTGGEVPDPTPAATPADPNMVLVPSLVGRPTQQAIAAASEAGLNWTLRCAEDPSRPEGIIDQEPPAGAEVRRGSAFTMYSARIADCR
jgi:eukaryotic-like serine/threonine-protein kinase